MTQSEFKELAQKHLADWIRKRNTDIQPGTYKSKHGDIKYAHILPLKEYNKGMRKDAIINAINEYHILTDGVELNLNVFPKNELHILANHLTSSQILCYNFFRLFLPEEICRSRQIPITQQLQQWLHKTLPHIPSMSESAVCEFEYKPDEKEGTSFDFCIHDDKTTVLFEIKYTEDGFGKAKKDDKHEKKFDSTYRNLIKDQNTVRSDVEMCYFLDNYQLFRNAIRANDNTFAVIIYPEHNDKCKKEFESFRDNWLLNSDSKRICAITWEKAFSTSCIAMNSELRDKYFGYENTASV